MQSVAFFNNKGGVGKTTLLCNIASHIARSQTQKVLVIDCDPQCNTTQLILPEEQCDVLYGESTQEAPLSINDVVRPIEVGESEIRADVTPMRSSTNRFAVDLIPGHPRMAIIEDLLSKAWSDASAGDIGGIRKSNWMAFVCERYAAEYDYLFCDLGPSLGSLNRSVLLGADYFVTPMGADIFSIVGVKNIADWFTQWLATYEAGLASCDRRYPSTVDQYGIRRDVPIKHGFVGYTVQQYITKSKQGRRRPTVAFERILRRIPDEIKGTLGTFFAPGINAELAKLGDVPNMFSLIPLAQSANAPISQLTSSDGLVGAQYSQQGKYSGFIGALAESLLRNTELKAG